MRELLPILLAAFAAVPASAASPQITPEERAKLIRYLEDSQKQFLSYLDGVTDAQWRWKPAPERWSVGETAEHIAISESFFFDLAMKAMANPADPDWETKTKGKTEFLERVLVNRTTKVKAPEPLDPGGLTMTRDEVIVKFKAARAKTIQFAQSTELPLREHLTGAPFPSLDPLNAYHFVLYCPLHNLRHNQQIAEVKATVGYPK